MSATLENDTIRLALPKGHLEQGVLGLLADANIRVRATSRGYRPAISLPGYETKILRPQNIVEMLALGSRDVGFAGADWVAEVDADLVLLLDCGLDPVRLVAAAPADLIGPGGELPSRRLVVASEYERLTREWIEGRGLEAAFVRSYGATEVFPPEDADLIVDNTSTGSTLRANKLAIVDELMRSATGLYANPAALESRDKRERIDELVLVLQAVLAARERVMVEVNVPEERLSEVIDALPCMREPTLSPLHGGAGYAVKAAVPREQLPQVIPEIKRRGGTDVVVTNLAQIVP
jgi:ATP phosphoribosyltransferase